MAPYSLTVYSPTARAPHRLVDDLFSQHLDLFILVPNGKHHKGVNTEKYVPNPRHTTPQALAMFEFVGRLLGIVLRHKHYLPFEFPPLVWKILAGQTPSAADLPLHDMLSSQFLDEVRNCEAHGVTNDAQFQQRFEAAQLRFVFDGCDGRCALAV